LQDFSTPSQDHSIERRFELRRGVLGADAGLGDSFSHAARAAGVAIMVSNSIGVKQPSAAWRRLR